MGKCAICGAYSKYYVLCSNCLKQLKQKAWEETIIEFERQYNLPESEESSEIFLHAKYEVWHNSCYDDLTEEEYKQRLFKEFSEIYFDKLVGCKLYTIKTGTPKNPNDTKYGLYY